MLSRLLRVIIIHPLYHIHSLGSLTGCNSNCAERSSTGRVGRIQRRVLRSD